MHLYNVALKNREKKKGRVIAKRQNSYTKLLVLVSVIDFAPTAQVGKKTQKEVKKVIQTNQDE